MAAAAAAVFTSEFERAGASVWKEGRGEMYTAGRVLIH